MVLGRVIGTVVATCKDKRLVGKKLLIVQPLKIKDLTPKGDPVVAVDTVGAGESEVVLMVAGSSARQTDKTDKTPVDAAIMAIVDSIELEGKLIFSKS
ncbi:ethanolamine utilization protein EutN [Anoxybacter fermentans]|uniref:Ethanolamine utilization protein EutN n=1 Tax=Anoxybacter fermentans TaxID=1323375 RepID=A0A3Q9HNV5_9FIRM|nr:EutN/CcmL family microcompartment protein [Anoxybacter fermentans]AZR72299.1 ethanolamine utilization protein EutN [Anoxybacter fermentans]